MCGIGGFSLAPGSSINPRRLSNALLTALEDRGYMASGFAWHSAKAHGVYKSDKPGSQLPLKALPKKAKTVILHTRLATHGSVTDNRNNHPVMSPNQDIALVHNGVIYNHWEVRSKVDVKLPDVDTSVIPALIEDAHLARLTELDGDAAIAWLSANDLGTLNVARLQHSPLVICQLEDGSFVFASTEDLLWRVLIQLDLQPEYMHKVDEYKYLRVRDGVILDFQDLEKPKHESYGYNYGYYRHQTAGAKGSSHLRAVPDSYLDDWGDDDEYWEAYHWNQSFRQSYAEEEDDDFSDAVVPNPPSDTGFWIEYRAKGIHTDNHFMWYQSDEEPAFRSDVWLLRNDHESDYKLVDFGSVTESGVLVSNLDK